MKKASAASIDTKAVLAFLGRSLPEVLPGVQSATNNWEQIAAVAVWLLTASVANQPDIADELQGLMEALQKAYGVVTAAFEAENPGYAAELQAAGMKLILVPPVPKETTTVQ